MKKHNESRHKLNNFVKGARKKLFSKIVYPISVIVMSVSIFLYLIWALFSLIINFKMLSLAVFGLLLFFGATRLSTDRFSHKRNWMALIIIVIFFMVGFVGLKTQMYTYNYPSISEIGFVENNTYYKYSETPTPPEFTRELRVGKTYHLIAYLEYPRGGDSKLLGGYSVWSREPYVERAIAMGYQRGENAPTHLDVLQITPTADQVGEYTYSIILAFHEKAGIEKEVKFKIAERND